VVCAERELYVISPKFKKGDVVKFVSHPTDKQYSSWFASHDVFTRVVNTYWNTDHYEYTTHMDNDNSYSNTFFLEENLQDVSINRVEIEKCPQCNNAYVIKK
jgi:hypothetical protein